MQTQLHYRKQLVTLRYVFNPSDVNELSALIIKMLSDEDEKKLNITNSEKRMKELGRQDYFENFWESLQTISNKY